MTNEQFDKFDKKLLEITLLKEGAVYQEDIKEMALIMSHMLHKLRSLDSEATSLRVKLQSLQP